MAAPALAGEPDLDQLSQLSIEQLANLQVTSVAKRPEPVGQAPAAIYVITHDDIIRSGATRLPDMLRMAPNLQVAQTGADSYNITARGFSGSSAAQNFSDKLLVLIDGRSVYTPLYSGVYWDMQDVPPEDIERIEVISGPGAALWGANAINGVINIITRKSGDTQGALVEAGAGNLEQSWGLQYSGRINSDLTYRVYAKTFFERDTVTAANQNADDHWTKPQAGFRLDWAASKSDSVTFEGDGYEGSEAQGTLGDQIISGADILGSWRHAWQDGSALQAQAYVDHIDRATQHNGGHFWIDTYDVDVQHSFALGGWNQIVWGAGFRAEQYRITGTSVLFFTPASRTLDIGNVFAQDTLSLSAATSLTLGMKLEDDAYTGLSVLPSARFSWRPTDTTLLWAAISRANRSATPFDRDVVEKVGGQVFLNGGGTFQPEELTAYEIGARGQIFQRASLSVSTFYNVYDDLRSIELAPAGFLPLRWGNGMRGKTYGLEAWGDYQALSWWRLSASFDLLHEDLSFVGGDPGIFGVIQAGDDPPRQAALKSSMTFAHGVTWDANLRWVDALPNPRVPSYTELNTRVGWAITPRLEFSISGFNLLHPFHMEYPTPATAIPRSLFADVRWRF
jgi:iron complex outermembrane receptor protein